MPLIQVPRAVTPCQVDVPDTVTNRSREGAIHIKPGVVRVTPEEWDHIGHARPDVAKQCHVVPYDETQSKVAALRNKEAASRSRESASRRAKNNPTRRQRRLAELEARKKMPATEKPVAAKAAKDVAAKETKKDKSK